MFTDQERSYFLRLARQSHQARLDPAGASPARLAWAYDLLDAAAASANDTPQDDRDPPPWDWRAA